MIKKELTPFETWMKNKLKKEKLIEDEKFIEEMLNSLKEKHEREKLEKIDELKKQFENLKN